MGIAWKMSYSHDSILYSKDLIDRKSRSEACKSPQDQEQSQTKGYLIIQAACTHSIISHSSKWPFH